MGFSSWNCNACGHSIRHFGAPAGVDKWMSEVVVLTPEGTRVEGVYDGYMRVSDAQKDEWVRLWDSTVAPDTNAYYHRACWLAAGRPAYAAPSTRADDQGHFVDPDDAQLPPPDELPSSRLRRRRAPRGVHNPKRTPGRPTGRSAEDALIDEIEAARKRDPRFDAKRVAHTKLMAAAESMDFGERDGFGHNMAEAEWIGMMMQRMFPTTVHNPNVSAPASTPWDKFEGERVAVAYNLNICGGGKPSKPGEACWTVRAKPSNSSAPIGYSASVLLQDCEFVINHGLLQRKRAAGKKDVFAFVVGTAVAMSPPPRGLPKGWYGVGFSPMAPPKGRGEDGFSLVSGLGGKDRQPIDHLAWFFGDGRKALGAIGAHMAVPRSNPAVNIEDLRETAAWVMDFDD